MDLIKTLLPSPEEIRQLPVFKNLSAENIILINNLEQCLLVANEIKSATILGFDTESKPTFIKGEVSTGPHLIQLASFEKAYLFQVSDEILEFLAPIFANPNLIKVGFGLKNDAHLFRKKGIELNGIVDLSKSFSAFGIKTQMGVKNAVALLFRVHFIKNKKVSTSNWSKKKLTPEQIAYAAADAYAPVLIFEELLRLGIAPQNMPNTALKFPIRPNQLKATSDA